MLSELKALRDIISSSVDTIVTAYEKASTEFPSLDDPLRSCHSKATCDPRRQSEVAEAISKIVAGSEQLIASVQAPALFLVNAMKAVSAAQLSLPEVCSRLTTASITSQQPWRSLRLVTLRKYFVKQDLRSARSLLLSSAGRSVNSGNAY